MDGDADVDVDDGADVDEELEAAAERGTAAVACGALHPGITHHVGTGVYHTFCCIYSKISKGSFSTV